MEPMKPMQPMKKMEPMETMQPVERMEPMEPPERWWPEHLGQPSSSGGQNRMRYAFFPDDYILLVETDGKLQAYDSGNHRISGVSQQQSRGQSLSFSSQNGNVDLNELKQVDLPL